MPLFFYVNILQRLIQSGSADFIFQPEIVGYHRDEFRIRGLSARVLYRVAKVGIQGLHVASVPRDLDGVIDFISSRFVNQKDGSPVFAVTK